MHLETNFREIASGRVQDRQKIPGLHAVVWSCTIEGEMLTWRKRGAAEINVLAPR